MFKKWSKSEISLRTAVMKIFNFWQNFDSTSNFHKSFKSTKEHFRIIFWDLQFDHKSEMTMFKKWSKSEISLRTVAMKMFNFWQNFDSISNLYKSFKSTKEHFRITFCDLQFTHKSEMTMFKKWSKSEISPRTAVMKIFNFWQNFDSTSNFHKSFKSTKELFRIPFWDVQLTHKSEMTMYKKWSKSEISLSTVSWKFSIFDKILTKTQTSTNPWNHQKNTLEYHFETLNSLTSQKWQCSKSGQNLKFR